MLHETTRKWICRRAFVACCLTPTLLVVGAVGYYHRPWRVTAISQQLSASMRAKVVVAQAWQPRPGVMQYRSIEVRDSRSDDLVLAADCLQVGRHFGTSTFRFDQLDLEVAGLKSLLRLLEFQLITSEPDEIHLQAKRLVIHHGQATDGLLNLENLQLHAKPVLDQQGQPTYQLKAHAEYQANGQWVPLGLMFNRWSPEAPEGSSRWKVELDLSAAALPGWILQDLLPGGPIFREALFQGKIEWGTDAQHTYGLLRGKHTDLQLQHLLSHGSQHQWSGRAVIDWVQLLWRDERVVEAEGLLRSGRGSASRSLFVDAVKLLYCQAAVELGSESSVAFDQLVGRFQIDASGLTLWGQCPLEPSGTSGQIPVNQPTNSRCLLTLQGKPLLWQSKYIAPVANMVWLATSPTNSWIPATHEAQQLARALPLPEVKRAK